MISGNTTDLLDSQESAFENAFVKTECEDFREFREFFDSQFSDDSGKPANEVCCSCDDIDTDVLFGIDADNEQFPLSPAIEEFCEQNPDILDQITGTSFNENNQPSTSSVDFANYSNLEHVQTAAEQIPINVEHYDENSQSSKWKDGLEEQTCSNGSRIDEQQFSKSIFGDNHPGACDFDVHFMNLSDVLTKSIAYTYSKILNKIYVQMKEVCPIQFNCNPKPPSSSIVKVNVFYKSPQLLSVPVKTCLLHKEYCSGDPASTGRLIQVLEKYCNVKYGVSEDGHDTVSFDYEASDNGIQTIRFVFTCLSSCKSGIKKRPVALAFALETQDGVVIGRKIVNLCICTRPGRDRLRDEKKLQPSTSSRSRNEPNNLDAKQTVKRSLSTLKPQTSNSNSDLGEEPNFKVQKDTDEVFTLVIQGRRKYERLRKIKEAFDLAELVNEKDRQEYYQNEANHD